MVYGDNEMLMKEMMQLSEGWTSYIALEMEGTAGG